MAALSQITPGCRIFDIFQQALSTLFAVQVKFLLHGVCSRCFRVSLQVLVIALVEGVGDVEEPYPEPIAAVSTTKMTASKHLIF